MKKEEILVRVKAMVSEQLDRELEDIKDEDTLPDLGADSLDMTEIMMRVEEEFNIQIEEDDITNQSERISLLSLVEIIQSKI